MSEKCWWIYSHYGLRGRQTKAVVAEDLVQGTRSAGRHRRGEQSAHKFSSTRGNIRP